MTLAILSDSKEAQESAKLQLLPDFEQRIVDAAALTYLGLWIYEGALRKWIVPGLGSQLYFARDMMLIAAVCLVLIYRRPKLVDAKVRIVAMLALAFTVLGAVQGIENQTSVSMTFTGVLQYVSPLIAAGLVVGRVSHMGTRSMLKLISISVWVQAFVSVTQVLSPQNSVINQTAPDQFQNLVTVGDMVRATGTFTAPVGLTAFLTLGCAVVSVGIASKGALPGLNLRGILRPVPLLLALLLTCAVSGSRASVVIVAFLLACGMFLRRSSLMPGYSIFKAGLLLCLVIAAASLLLPSVTQGFQQRFEDANRSESSSGRVVLQATGYLHVQPDDWLLGDGMGTHTQAGIALMQKGTWIENEMSRWVAELGLLGLLLCVLRQMLLFPILWLLWCRSRDPQDALAAMCLLALAPSLLAGQLNAQPSLAGFSAISIGIILSRLKGAQSETRPRNECEASPASGRSGSSHGLRDRAVGALVSK